MMLKTLIKDLRAVCASGLRRVASRFAMLLVFSLLISVVASAYTVVMKSGRRVEIPDNFTVTQDALIYEVAPDIRVSLQLPGIDIPATERANREAAGSFLKRIGQEQTQSAMPTTNRARKTLTDKDVEVLRRARVQNEEADRQRRAAAGLPPIEEVKRRNDAEAARALEVLRQSAQADAENEAYWRARASALRTEIAALDAQINYLREVVAQMPDSSLSAGYTVATTVLPFGHGFGRAGHPFGIVNQPGVYSAPGIGAGIAGRVRFGGGATRGQVLLNAQVGGGFPPAFPPLNSFGQQLLLSPPFLLAPRVIAAAPLAIYSTSAPFYDFYAERAAYLARLNELELQRTGLRARWNELEDEARRAGALPGWLRE